MNISVIASIIVFIKNMFVITNFIMNNIYLAINFNNIIKIDLINSIHLKQIVIMTTTRAFKIMNIVNN